jgi:putative ABC transport system substrate-binding protein
MHRRRFVLRIAVLAVVSVGPALGERIGRVGFLGPRSRSDGAPYYDAFLQGLRDLGWSPGKTVMLEERWADGHPERLPRLASELVRLDVDVIVAATTTAAVAAEGATNTIPIVFVAGEPVRLKLVQSLARPGGNITGVAFGVGSQTFAKGLELLKEAVPTIRRIAVLSNPANPSHAEVARYLDASAGSLGVEIRQYRAREPADFEGLFAAMAKDRAEALLVIADSSFGLHRRVLIALAARQRLPAMYGLREFPEAGGLMSYNVDARDSFRRAAVYVDRILKGARPADLPVEQPSRFELVINRATARALGIAMPQSLLLRAELIE